MQEKNYKFKRGDTETMEAFKVSDAEGNPIVLTSQDQIYFTMRNSNDEVKLKKKIGNGITLNDEGYYCAMFNPADTQDLDVEDEYTYDIELDLNLDTGLYVKTIIGGKVSLKADITRKEDRT